MTAAAAQALGDCLEVQCDGQGALVTVPVISDPFDDAHECTVDTCDSGAAVHTPQPAKTPCTENGGKLCDAMGGCVACLTTADCASGSCIAGACIAGNCAAGMVDAGGFCIDAVETTNAAYLLFLAGIDPGQAAQCAWNATYVPVSGAPPNDTVPVTRIDWCDAVAYCKWSGKRLCGAIGGGTNAYGSHADATKSQWYAACSSGGANAYPYGASYQATTCNGAAAGNGKVVALAAASTCHGVAAPLDALYDMSGNTWEWEDSCTGAAGPVDSCRLRGGSYNNAMAIDLACNIDYAVTRQSAFASVGFRCCSP